MEANIIETVKLMIIISDELKKNTSILNLN